MKLKDVLPEVREFIIKDTFAKKWPFIDNEPTAPAEQAHTTRGGSENPTEKSNPCARAGGGLGQGQSLWIDLMCVMFHDCFRLSVDKIHEQMQSNVY